MDYQDYVYECNECGETFSIRLPYSRLIDEKKWYPKSIYNLSLYLNQLNVDPNKVPKLSAIKSNICYNLQYLEYLNVTLLELNLSSVLWTQTIKTYIIVGTSIIEALLYALVCENDLNIAEWKEVNKTKTNDFKINGESYKIENTLYEKLKKPEFEELNLDRMLKKIEKRKLISNNSEFYSKINGLRKLRNTIHIHITDEKSTDYKTFYRKELILLNVVLHEILTSRIFSPNINSELFDFLVLKE